VAYSGGPVLIAKHERARVAVVPLDMLARDEARFRAAAERALTRRQAARQPASDEVDFEDVPGLGEADLAAERVKIDLLARNEDVCDRGPAGRRVHQPARSPWPISSTARRSSVGSRRANGEVARRFIRDAYDRFKLVKDKLLANGAVEPASCRRWMQWSPRRHWKMAMPRRSSSTASCYAKSLGRRRCKPSNHQSGRNSR